MCHLMAALGNSGFRPDPWLVHVLCCCRLQGHQDIISGIGYLPSPLDCYVTSSWDQQLRLWRRPQPSGSSSSGAGAGAGASRAGVGGRLEAPGLLPEDSEEGQVVSEYEKANPLVVPKALSQVGGFKTALRLGSKGHQSKQAHRRQSPRKLSRLWSLLKCRLQSISPCRTTP